MKRLRTMLAVLCALALISGGASFAEPADGAATPTDLTAVPQEEIGPEEPEDIVSAEPEEPAEAQPDVTNPVGTDVTDPAENSEADPEQGEGHVPDQVGETDPEQNEVTAPEQNEEPDQGQEEVTDPEQNEESGQEKLPEPDPEQEPEQEETEEETEAEAEVDITGPIAVGGSWEGIVKHKVPTILKLDLTRDQPVRIVVRGRNLWASVRKADSAGGEAPRKQTDPETDLLVISFQGTSGSWLISVGAGDGSLMAKASVSVMDLKAFEAWEAENVSAAAEPSAENTKEDGCEETGAETINETGDNEPGKLPETEETETETMNGNGDAEPGTEPEPEETASEGDENPEEAGETKEPESAEETAQEAAEEAEEEQPGEETPEEETSEEEVPESEATETPAVLTEEEMTELGYRTAVVIRTEGAGLFAAMDDQTVPSIQMAAGTMLMIRIEDETWAAAQMQAEDGTPCTGYVKLDDIALVLDGKQEEELPVRSIRVTSTIQAGTVITVGTEVFLSAELEGFREDDLYEVQWQYSPDGGETVLDMEGANGLTHSYRIDKQNYAYVWRLVITLRSPERETA